MLNSSKVNIFYGDNRKICWQKFMAWQVYTKEYVTEVLSSSWRNWKAITILSLKKEMNHPTQTLQYKNR